VFSHYVPQVHPLPIPRGPSCPLARHEMLFRLRGEKEQSLSVRCTEPARCTVSCELSLVTRSAIFRLRCLGPAEILRGQLRLHPPVWPHHLQPAASSDVLSSSPALPPGPLPSFWMIYLNDSDSVGYDRFAVKAVLRSLRCHQHRDDSALDKKKIITNRDNPGRARSWSGRLKLSFRVVWDSAKIAGLVWMLHVSRTCSGGLLFSTRTDTNLSFVCTSTEGPGGPFHLYQGQKHYSTQLTTSSARGQESTPRCLQLLSDRTPFGKDYVPPPSM
jgi:hypothetical protein